MAFNVYHDPRSVTIGAAAIQGVTRIAWETTSREMAVAGDDDAHISFARHGTQSTRGTITFLSLDSADAAAGARGTLSFTVESAKDEADKTVTIEGCSVGGYDAMVRTNAASLCTLPFLAEGPAVISDAS
jgi:hypothetical protein